MEALPLVFLRIEFDDGSTISGGSSVERYEGRIPIQTFSFKLSSKDNKVRRAGQTSKANIDLERVSVSKAFDTSSFELARLAKIGNTEGGRFLEARLTVDQHKIWTKASMGEKREQNAIIVFHLWHGYIASVKWGASESGKGASIRETVELAYKQVSIEYYALDWKAPTREGRTLRRDAPFPFEYMPEIHEE